MALENTNRVFCKDDCVECQRAQAARDTWKYGYNTTYTYTDQNYTQTPNTLGYNMEKIRKAINGGTYMYDSIDNKLTIDLKKLDMTEDDKLLTESGVLDSEGNLTRKGASFVITVLFNENKALVVSKLQAIKDANDKTKALATGKSAS